MALTVGQTVDLSTVALEELVPGTRFRTPTNIEVEIASVVPGANGEGRAIRTFNTVVISSPDPRQNGQAASFPILVDQPSLAPITQVAAPPASAAPPVPAAGFGGFPGSTPEFPPSPEQVQPPVAPPVQPPVEVPPTAPADSSEQVTLANVTPEIRQQIAATIVAAFTNGGASLEGVEAGASVTAMGVRSKLKQQGINPAGDLLADVATKDLGLRAENFRFHYGAAAVAAPPAPPAPQAAAPAQVDPVTAGHTELERGLDAALAADNLRDTPKEIHGVLARVAARPLLYTLLEHPTPNVAVDALTTLVSNGLLTVEEARDALLGFSR